MSSKIETTVKCPSCGRDVKATVYKSIWGEYPENRRFIYDDRINAPICTGCKNKIYLQTSLFYNNPRKLIAAWYEPIKDYSNIHPQNKELNRMLGAHADYMTNAIRIKDWSDFKKHIKNKENDNDKADFMSFSTMDEYLKRKVNELGYNDQILCKHCNKSNAMSALRGTCIDCTQPFPNKGNFKLYQIALFSFIYFLCEFDTYINDDSKLSIVSNLYETVNKIHNEKKSPDANTLNHIKNIIFNLKSIGSERAGGLVQIENNAVPKLMFSEKNGMVHKNAAINLAPIFLAYEYIRNYESPKKWWQL